VVTGVRVRVKVRVKVDRDRNIPEEMVTGGGGLVVHRNA
jgi:hypothetical protein